MRLKCALAKQIGVLFGSCVAHFGPLPRPLLARGGGEAVPEEQRVGGGGLGRLREAPAAAIVLAQHSRRCHWADDARHTVRMWHALLDFVLLFFILGGRGACIRWIALDILRRQ